MAEPYLKDLNAIVERASAPREAAAEVSCKHFFSGAAAYADGRIFMTLTSVGLALKLPEDDRNTLRGQGAEPLRYFPGAPVKKDYVLLPVQLIDDGGALNGWISRSIEFVRK
jgi:TfoX/Sxy family transcriptional regulator of competence genes